MSNMETDLTNSEIKKLKSIIKPYYDIKGKKYKVEWHKRLIDENGRELRGACYTEFNIIQLSEEQHFIQTLGFDWAKKRLLTTLYHEAGHGLHEEIGLHVTGMPHDALELFTHNHAAMMVDTFNLDKLF